MKEKTAKAFFTKELSEIKIGGGCWSYCWNKCNGMFGMQIWCLTGCLARCANKGVGGKQAIKK